jgi:hypothetical protein
MTRKTKRFSNLRRAILPLSLCASAVLSAPLNLAAAADAQLNAFLERVTPDLRPFYQALYIDGYRNAVLNFNRIGVMELERGNVAVARWAFEKATDQINLIYADDPNARAAKSAWSAEKIKDFKGEPYERSMSFYYLGLTDLLRGDYQNARAAFLQSQYQDTFADDEKFQGDFAISNYLTGWASQCDGSTAQMDDNYNYALQASPTLAKPGADHNVLMIAEVGSGPIKAGKGKYAEFLRYEPGTNYGTTGARFSVAGTGDFATMQATNVSFQAVTRGGRPIEEILDNKAAVKDLACMGSLRCVDVDNAKSRRNFAAGFGGGNAMERLVISRAVEANADLRYWDNLPEDVAVATGAVAGPITTATVAAAGSGVTKNALVGGGGKCTLVWARLGTPANIPPVAPNTVLKDELTKEMRAKDAAFRTALMNDGIPN